MAVYAQDKYSQSDHDQGNYESASDTFTADPSLSDCGHACHVTVKAKDHIFHPYQKR
jgi:hypothetical protein